MNDTTSHTNTYNASSPQDAPQSERMCNEQGWPILYLDGARPKELSKDPAGVNAKHCTRLMALEIMRALKNRAEYGKGLEVDGPWVIEAKKVWNTLGYGEDLASLDGRYTRWMDEQWALRSQTSALVPEALLQLAAEDWPGGVIVLPGRVWRRDLRDKIHIGDPRQMDIWILKKGWQPGREDLLSLVKTVMSAADSTAKWSAIEATHPYTLQGIEVEAQWEGKNLEVLECGLAHPDVLEKSGLKGWGGLALGMGLDRLCMLRKTMGDIRDLDSLDPKAMAQVMDLKPWRPWSRQPLAVRDISVSVQDDWDAERVVDAAASALSRLDLLEGIEVVGSWSPQDLPEVAKTKLGMMPNQMNWLLKIKLRDWHSAVPRELADAEARKAWDALHQGSNLIYRP